MPLIGDIALDAVQLIEHAQDGGFVSTRIAGLPGELQQRLARPSHRIRIAGVLFGDEALDKLGTLQKAAQDGAEVTFAADITTALELKKVVVSSFWAQAEAGMPDRYPVSYTHLDVYKRQGQRSIICALTRIRVTCPV